MQDEHSCAVMVWLLQCSCSLQLSQDKGKLSCSVGSGGCISQACLH